MFCNNTKIHYFILEMRFKKDLEIKLEERFYSLSEPPVPDIPCSDVTYKNIFIIIIII